MCKVKYKASESHQLNLIEYLNLIVLILTFDNYDPTRERLGDVLRNLNLKNMINIHGGVLLLVKLQASTLVQITFLQGCFGFKLYIWCIWYQSRKALQLRSLNKFPPGL